MLKKLHSKLYHYLNKYHENYHKTLVLNNNLSMFNVKNNNNNNNSLMFNMKNRNKNNNDNNIMIRQSITLMTSNVSQSILNSVHPLINPVKSGIHVLCPGQNLG